MYSDKRTLMEQTGVLHRPDLTGFTLCLGEQLQKMKKTAIYIGLIWNENFTTVKYLTIYYTKY